MRSVIFDVWHTLIEPAAGDEEYYGLRVRRLLESCGLNPSPDQLSRALEVYSEVRSEVEAKRRATLIEVPAEEEISLFFRRLGIDCAVGPEQLRAYAEPFLRLTVLKEGAREVVEFLHRAGLALGALANSPYGEMVRLRLREAGLSGHFRAIVCSGDVGRRKPHPVAFQAVLRGLNSSPSEALMVGDDPGADVGGAKSIGMRAVWVLRPGVAPPDDADGVVVDLRDLLKVVRDVGWLT